MGLIKDITPLNLTAEKSHFFAQAGQYNPQFVYSKPIDPRKLVKYGLPRADLVAEITELLPNFTPKNSSSSEVPKLSEAEVISYLNQLFNQLQVPPLEIIFDQQQTSRTMINAGRGTINFRLPLDLTAAQLASIAHHEIETHYLRSLNNLQQPWHSEKRPPTLWKRTEEGLALYNTAINLAEPAQKILLQRYQFQYYLIDQALQHSFAEVYQRALSFFRQPEKAFNATLFIKRGLTDTSQPGGFTKGIVYYEGYLQIKNWLANGGHYQDLYWGKIAIEEIAALRSFAQTDNLHYPTFLDKIGK